MPTHYGCETAPEEMGSDAARHACLGDGTARQRPGSPAYAGAPAGSASCAVAAATVSDQTHLPAVRRMSNSR